jgi:hypothetical protein
MRHELIEGKSGQRAALTEGGGRSGDGGFDSAISGRTPAADDRQMELRNGGEGSGVLG